MKTFPLTVFSLEGDNFSGEVISISLRSVEGDLAILAGHTPFITSVVSCDVSIVINDNEIKKGHTDGGLLTVSKEGTSLLSGNFVWC